MRIQKDALNSAIMRYRVFHNLFRELSLAATVGALLALGGCVAAPVDSTANAEQAGPMPDVGAETEAPELTLNLPHQNELDCTDPASRDNSFLRRGIDALVAGDHIEAVTYFQRYARLESSPLADWEAGIAIAYDSMLAQSPFYDLQAANASYRALQKQSIDTSAANPQVLMMQEALATFSELQGEIGELQADKAQLMQELAKREEALKRLRELTLGQ